MFCLAALPLSPPLLCVLRLFLCLCDARGCSEEQVAVLLPAVDPAEGLGHNKEEVKYMHSFSARVGDSLRMAGSHTVFLLLVTCSGFYTERVLQRVLLLK